MTDKIKQWPDHITSGEIRYARSDNYDGFYLADTMHGIPTFGSVSPTDPVTIRGQHVKLFNYPGQTEEIAKALCDRWNAHRKLVAALANLLTTTDPYRNGADTPAGCEQELNAREQAVKALHDAGYPISVQSKDGWIDWAGDDADNAPVIALVDIERRDGLKGRGWSESMFWHHDGRGDDIVRYRVIA